MRIAYLSLDPGIPIFGSKGASVHVQEVVREFLALGHEVSVFTTRKGKEVPADLADLPLREYKIGTKDAAERELAQQQITAAMVADIAEWGADFVYERYSLFSMVLADTTLPGILEVNAPLIDEQKTHRVLVNEDQAFTALTRQAQAASAVVCVSDPVRDWVLTHVPTAQAHTVPNGVSINRIQPSPEATGTPVVTFVGTLKPWHGVSDLIEAAACAQHDWLLRIIGDGPERVSLETQAAKLGVQVDFRGAVVPENMPAEIAGSALGVAPYPAASNSSEHYFSPLKVYEYLAAGLPVVATDIGQIPELIDGAGLLVPGSDPAALAAAIDRLVADPSIRARLGATARTLAVQKHSWSSVVARIFDLAQVPACG